MIKENSKINLISDNPIGKIKYDALDFDTYAEVLSETILETPSPFRIGIFGEWGKGKSSLMNFLMNETFSNKNKKRVINIFYDALKFEKNNNPTIELLNIIEQTILTEKTKIDESLAVTIMDYLKYIKNAISKIDKISEYDKSEYKDNSLLEIYDLLKKLENLLVEEEFLIIVYIDNLDRCNSLNSLKILESMNIIFNLRGFSFVIAANKDLLEEQLSSTIKDSKEYLNKTIQLPFYIPPLHTKVNDLLNTLSLNSQEELGFNIKNVIYSISTSNILTPRLVIRLINRIKICSKIYMKLNPNTQISYENVLSLFSISCILDELFEDFHFLIMKNSSVTKSLIRFMQNENFYKDEAVLNIDISSSEKNLLIDILENDFQILKMIFGTEQGKYWLENKSYRISTYEFLKSNNEMVENINIESLPIYKTDFSDNIVDTEEKVIDPKEFIKVPNQDYEISKYAIINKWFEEFILAKGYDNPNYWTDIAAKVWLINNKISSLDEKYNYMIEKESAYFKKKFDCELLKENFNSDFQPIVYITYYEAVAFCKYLSGIDSEYEYLIPSKEQWEYIASGGDATRVYPWGDAWNNNYCNNATNQLYRTTKIGLFPQGNSKFGVSDMVGNVWVWTSTLDSNDYNYLKGGSWNFSDPSYFKIKNTQMTFYNNPSYQHYDIGFLCIRKKR